MDALIEFNPHREVIDVRELNRQLNALTGAGVDYTQRYRVVRDALAWVTTLLDRLEPRRNPNVTHPNFARVWHER